MRYLNSILFLCVLSANQAVAQEESIFEKIRKKQTNTSSSSVKLTAQEEQFKQAYLQELQKFTVQYMQEFAQFKAEYNRELADYRSRLLAQWGEVDISDNNKVVNYPDEETKAAVDFEKQEIIVSIIHNKNDNVDLKKVAAAIDSLRRVKQGDITPQTDDNKESSVDIIAEYSGSKVIQKSDELVADAKREHVTPEVLPAEKDKETDILDKQATQDARQLDIIGENANISEDDVATVKASVAKSAEQNKIQARQRREQVIQQNAEKLKDKRITRFRIPIQPKSEQKRIASVKPDAQKYADAWQLPLELIIAIIHTESSFNPMAVSHIPAYGLMQIVPYSAGIDINDFLFKKRAPLQPDYLFNSPQNIEAGAAYLHILDSRYLSAISQPQNRLYCVIAAYNTGAGNVAKAFSKGKVKKLTKALAEKINNMQPQQVYDTLINNLPYEETQRYLKKVKQRMQHYKQII
ncbi:transglycosylase SLT domain-containing protein [Alteromonadaceae bacterium BrNp21-10]|nr:transglycosylase SLT domain-containing protein [Alteromonadaceae bacterium BrNp21-10]